MKLINADELKKEFPHDEDWDFPVNTNGYVVETINRMSTIDAVPTKWIKEWIDRNAEYTGYTSYLLSVVEMLDDWRKENEISDWFTRRIV